MVCDAVPVIWIVKTTSGSSGHWDFLRIQFKNHNYRPFRRCNDSCEWGIFQSKILKLNFIRYSLDGANRNAKQLYYVTTVQLYNFRPTMETKTYYKHV